MNAEDILNKHLAEAESASAETLPAFRAAIRAWVEKNLTPERGDLGVWEKRWFNSHEHLVTKLRVMVHDHGAWIIILSCSASYAGNEDEWKGVNIGDVKSIEQLDAILAAMNVCDHPAPGRK